MTGITAITAPTQTPGRLTTALTVGGRTTLKLLRTPQVFGIAVVQSIVFLLMFRYVLGGAIGVSGVTYAEFLIPGFVVSGLLFTGGGSAVSTTACARSRSPTGPCSRAGRWPTPRSWCSSGS